MAVKIKFTKIFPTVEELTNILGVKVLSIVINGDELEIEFERDLTSTEEGKLIMLLSQLWRRLK